MARLQSLHSIRLARQILSARPLDILTVATGFLNASPNQIKLRRPKAGAPEADGAYVTVEQYIDGH